jgi:hypothetical protein
MKKILSLILAMLMALSLFVGATAEEAAAIDVITVGTTSVIETATRDEYAYDMLASGTSELPMAYQDTNGVYHPLMAEFATEDATTWTYTIVDGMTCTAEPYDFESSLDDELYFDEDGNLITDETEPLEGPGETYPEEVAESNPPAPTAEDTPSTTEEATVPATTAPAETTEETKAA